MTSTLIKNAMIALFDRKRTFIERGWIFIENDRIRQIGYEDQTQPEADYVYDFEHHLVMPGFVNIHAHLQQYFRGLYELIGDFYQVNLPLEGYRLDEDMETLGLASAAEFVYGGCTTSLVIYTYPEGFAKAVKKAGNRVYLASDIEEVDLKEMQKGKYSFLPEKGKAAFERAVHLYEDWEGAGEGRIRTLMCPKATDLVLPETYQKVKEFAKERNLRITTHLAQSVREYQQVMKLYDMSPTGHLANLGILDEQLIAAHCVYTSPQDELMILDSGASIAQSTFISAPFMRWKDMGIPVGLGTDDMFHDTLQMLRSTRQAQQYRSNMVIGLDQMVASDRYTSRPSPYELLEMATIGSAKAIGMDSDIGSLETGKKADLIAVDFNNPLLSPTSDPITSLLLCGNSGNIAYVMVDGKIIKDPSGMKNFNLPVALDQAQNRVNLIVEKFFSDFPEQKKRWLKKLSYKEKEV